MLVANSFDLWQKDTFFSTAEEVQKSADIMESAYRTWLRARGEGLMPQHLDALERELQMALGTAKWQLDELERAVLLSYKSPGGYITITRHSQFVSAIEDQIANVEKAFKESSSFDGKKPFRWVNLNDEECDDLALFLSGTSSSHMATDEKNNAKEVSSEMQMPKKENHPQEVAAGNAGDVGCQADRTASNQRTCGPQEKGTLEIVVIDGDGDDGEKNALVGEMCKEKVSAKPSFWSTRVEERVGAKGVLSRNNIQLRMVSWINQQLRGGQRQRQLQVSPILPVNSIRFILALMLTIFLVVPFLVFSSGAELNTMDH